MLISIYLRDDNQQFTIELGRSAAQRAFVDSHPDTRQAFESMISSLYAQGSSHASEAARLAATVQDMRAAAKAYMENNGVPQISSK